MDRSGTATGHSGSGMGVAEPSADDGSASVVAAAPVVAAAVRLVPAGVVSGRPVATHPAMSVSATAIGATRRSPPGERRADLEPRAGAAVTSGSRPWPTGSST